MSDQFTSDSLYDSEPAPAVPPAKPAALWEDFMDIFYAPSDVFARRERSGFGVPMLIVTVLIGVIALVNLGVMQPIMDAEFTRATAVAMKKNPQLTAEQMGKFRGMGEKFAAVFVFVATPLAMFFTGLWLWLAGKIVDAKQSFGAALMVACYSYLPKVIAGIAAGVQGLLMDPASMTGQFKVSLGLGRFLDPDATSPALVALAGRMDLFTIWVTILLVIGLSVTGKIPRSKAAIAGVVVWIIGALPTLLPALRS
ncbi:MAG: Yip1 family protein [bacterium]